MFFKKKLTLDKMRSRLNLNNTYNNIIKVGEKYLVLEDNTFDDGMTGQVDIFMPEIGKFGGAVKKPITTATYTVNRDHPGSIELELDGLTQSEIVTHIVKHVETLAALCTFDIVIVDSKTTNIARDKVMKKLGYEIAYSSGYIKRNPECYMDDNDDENLRALYEQTFGEKASERQ